MNHFLGDPFALDRLILPRPACAYGLQRLGTDQLWSASRCAFVEIRKVSEADLFAEFEAASQAGLQCLEAHPETPLAIVPITWDPVFERFVLVHGVILP